MFDITSSKLLILGIVALLVIGPKDLPALLRTIGKYMGMIKRQAAEFRAQFDEAMRESEIHELTKSMESIQRTLPAMKKWTPGLKDSLKNAGEEQTMLAEETDLKIEKLAQSPVFKHILTKAQKSMDQAAKAITELRREAEGTGDLDDAQLKAEKEKQDKIVKLQKDAGKGLARLVEALKEETQKKRRPEEWSALQDSRLPVDFADSCRL